VNGATQSYRALPAAEIAGETQVPGDKSISHRALMLGAIAEGETEIVDFLDSEDCLATLNAMRAMGVRIERPAATRVQVAGVGREGLRAASGALDMGNAGTAMRLSMGLLAGQAFDSRLVGDASLSRRPMERAAVPLRHMGARIDTTDGRPPVLIRGGTPLVGLEHELKVPSAQVKSAILLAGLYASGRTIVRESAVTRDHTERMLKAFGVELRAGEGRVVLEGGQRLKATRIAVPGDISSAAFLLVAGALGARRGLLIRNVGVNRTRTGVIEILTRMGAKLRLLPAARAGDEPVADLEIRASRLTGIRVPRELVPLAIDEFPALFIAAAAAEGTTVVEGAEELRVKESDRIAVMAEGLTALGARAEPTADGIVIEGGSRLRGGEVDSHGDHRIAMSFAIASLIADGPIIIRDVANVATSFPGFPALVAGIGLNVEAPR
jgi:3-phosphoshikimate 1-carboxyvinyltransferase